MIQHVWTTFTSLLHWFKIKQRIQYKIISLTYTALQTGQPHYIRRLFIVNTVPLALPTSSLYHAQPLPGSKFLIVHSISKHPPSGIPYLHIYRRPHLNPAMVSVSLLSSANNSWHSSKLICSINPSHLALNDSRQCSTVLHPSQTGSPPMRLSVTMVVALLLASAKSWFHLACLD